MAKNDLKRVSFSGHETFSFRLAWLKKGVDYVHSGGGHFDPDQAMVALGVGKNMARSIRHWCLSLKLIALADSRRLVVTQLGELLFDDDTGVDLYLEDPGTLWLLHWMLATNVERATTWNWVLSYWHHPEFTKADLVQTILEKARDHELTNVSSSSVERDVDCFVKTYVPSRVTNTVLLEDTLDCPMTELRLITELDHSTYRLNRGNHSTLPDLILAHMIKAFWSNGAYVERKSLSFADLAYQPGSPGRVLRLDENSMAERLERLERVTDGAFRYDETAGVKVLFQGKPLGEWDLLHSYYWRNQKG